MVNGNFELRHPIAGIEEKITIIPNEGSIWYITHLKDVVPTIPKDRLNRGYEALNKLNADFATEGAYFIEINGNNSGTLCYKFIVDKILQEPPRGEIFLTVKEICETIEANLEELLKYLRD
jgi:hypothetical protein